MYQVSADFLNAIKAKVRHPHWSGSINTATPIALDDDSFISCSIQKSIAGNKLEIGTVYAGQITAELYLPTVSRYELYEKVIEISMSIEGADDEIPMGFFTITEATQTADHIKIKGYDDMVKFANVKFNAIENNIIQSPYAWIEQACNECDVTFGMELEEVEALPNGIRNTGFASVITDVATWRDVISYLASYLGSFAYIDRNGELRLGIYTSSYVDTVPSNLRYSSNLSDYITTFNGLYHVYKDGGMQEYVENENEDGLILNLGSNPFLQFSNNTNRLDALQAIIDVWNDVYYVPFNGQMPLMSHYDVGDVLRFADNQATQYDIGAITDITYDIKLDVIKIKCCGDNPQLMSAQDRFAKSVEGISNDYNNSKKVGGDEFWMLHTTNTSVLTVGSTEVQIAEIEYNQTTYGQKLEMILTVNAELSDSATVNIRVVVDDDVDLEMNVTEEKTFAGKRIFKCSNPQNVYGVGIHACKVYMTVTDNAINVGDLY